MTKSQDQIINEAYIKLISEIKKYRPSTPLDLVEEAFSLAVKAHDGQLRFDGDPFVIHPIAVATILAEIRTDLESIAAGLLHDVVEDTTYTSSDITNLFGAEVSSLVNGVTKIKKIAYVSKTEEQAENYRKMFFHMSQDVRVLLIKLADRLHNMRTLGVRREDKQIKVATETLEIYAPLAHRLGIAKLRHELEDLGFKYTDRERYNDLAQKVKLRQEERHAYVQQIMAEIKERLETDEIEAKVEGRPKQFYSIYKKMKGKNRTLEQIHDLYAVRVLVKTVGECYEVLGRIHDMYTPIPGRLKDFIGMKKPNGYQSLHTSLMGSAGIPFEVQIRTFEMHEVSEYGIAAHWKYKEGGKLAKDQWLQDIMSWQRGMSSSGEFLDALKMDLNAFKAHVYCFSPTGDIVQLVDGSNVIDFAYAIHSAVGNRMVGARVNGRIVPIDYILQTGDQVEILTSENQKGPNRDWLKIVKSNQARSKITQFYNKANREENIQKGKAMLEDLAKEFKLTLTELLADGREEATLNRFGCKDLTKLFALVGVGGVKEKQVINHIYKEYAKTLPPPTDEDIIKRIAEANESETEYEQSSGIVIEGLDGDIGTRLARCCGPLPGDDVIGFTTRGRGLSVHRKDCTNILHLTQQDRLRLVEVKWPQTGRKSSQTYHAELRFVCPDRKGLAADITRVLDEENAPATSLLVRADQANAIVNVGIKIFDGSHLEIVMTKLKNIVNAQDVERVNG